MLNNTQLISRTFVLGIGLFNDTTLLQVCTQFPPPPHPPARLAGRTAGLSRRPAATAAASPLGNRVC